MTDRSRLDAWLQDVDVLTQEAPDDATEEPTVVGKVWARLPKERDLELHLRTGWLAGTEYLQLADFVPSTGRYETAVFIESRLLRDVVRHLFRVNRFLGHRSPTLP